MALPGLGVDGVAGAARVVSRRRPERGLGGDGPVLVGFGHGVQLVPGNWRDAVKADDGEVGQRPSDCLIADVDVLKVAGPGAGAGKRSQSVTGS
jgi:hypothetical protein